MIVLNCPARPQYQVRFNFSIEVSATMTAASAYSVRGTPLMQVDATINLVTHELGLPSKQKVFDEKIIKQVEAVVGDLPVYPKAE